MRKRISESIQAKTFLSMLALLVVCCRSRSIFSPLIRIGVNSIAWPTGPAPACRVTVRAPVKR